MHTFSHGAFPPSVEEFLGTFVAHHFTTSHIFKAQKPDNGQPLEDGLPSLDSSGLRRPLQSSFHLYPIA